MKYLFILSFLLVTACATVPKDALTYDEINLPDSSHDKSTLVFYRRYTPPLAYEMKVHIDGKQVTSLPNNAFSYISLKPGLVTLKTSWSAWSGMPSREKSLEIPLNTTVYVELSSSVYTPAGIELGVSKSQAQEKSQAVASLKKCCKYVSAKL